MKYSLKKVNVKKNIYFKNRIQEIYFCKLLCKTHTFTILR